MLEKIKRRLGIHGTLQDELILDLIEDTTSHYKALTGALIVEPKYEFIIKDVVSVRYNRMNAMGLESETTPDYSANYRDPAKDFHPYLEVLDKEYHFLGEYKPGSLTFF